MTDDFLKLNSVLGKLKRLPNCIIFVTWKLNYRVGSQMKLKKNRLINKFTK